MLAKFGYLLSAAILLSATTFAAATGKSADGDRVLLTAGDVVITVADFHHYIQERLDAGNEPEALTSERGLAQALENLMSIRVLAQRALEQGVELDDQLKWELELHRDRLLFRRLQALEVAEIMANTDWEAAAREEYIAHPNRFRTAEQVRVSHILISTQERSEEEALELAQALLRRLQEGESLSELAREYSEDPSAGQNGGDLGFFERRQMVPPFAEAAFALEQPGQLSEPVQTRFGYHLIQFHERKPAGRRDFSEVKEVLVQDLQQPLASRVRSRHTTAARSVDYEVDEELLVKLIRQRQSELQQE